MTVGTIVMTGADGTLGSEFVKLMREGNPAWKSYGVYTVRKWDDGDLEGNGNGEGPRTKWRRKFFGDHGHSHDLRSLDLTDLEEVRKFARRINERVKYNFIPPIRALVLNAGFCEWDKATKTKEDWDTTFVANYLGHWLLTMLLLQSMSSDARIIVVGCNAHDPQVDFSYGHSRSAFKTKTFPDAAAIASGNWAAPEKEGDWRSGFMRFGASKMCLLMFARTLADRLDDDLNLRCKRIDVLGFDPGVFRSGMTAGAPWSIRSIWTGRMLSVLHAKGTDGKKKFLGKVIYRSAHESARDLTNYVFSSSSPWRHRSFKYMNGCKVGQTSEQVGDREMREDLWWKSICWTRLTSEETRTGLRLD